MCYHLQSVLDMAETGNWCECRDGNLFECVACENAEANGDDMSGSEGGSESGECNNVDVRRVDPSVVGKGKEEAE